MGTFSRSGAGKTKTTKVKAFMIDIASPLKIAYRRYRLLLSFCYDYRRFVKHSSAVYWGDNMRKLESLIMMRLHGIEKGLSLEQPRLGFGQKVLADLFAMMEQYAEREANRYIIGLGLSVIDEYIQFHKQKGFDVSSVEEKFELLSKTISRRSVVSPVGGVEIIRKQDMYKKSAIDFESFCNCRYSVRQFSEESVPKEVLVDAIRVAQKTPSVCNRQSSKVWVITDKSKIQEVLEIGGGATGFGEQIQAVLIVTSDLASFVSGGERNQCWIDGGMFAMSLIYSLHAKGLVSCCMNWSKEYRVDCRIRKCVNMCSSENILLLVGVGYPREDFAVARSTRKPIDDIVVFV